MAPICVARASYVPEAVENKALGSGNKKLQQTKCGQASETFGYRGVYKVTNHCSLFLGRCDKCRLP
jgi:hypothetical protein